MGTRGIDLTGNTGTGDFIITGSSSITGVGVGVDLTNASRPGLFQYGDGENAVDVASFITLAPADQPIVVAGLNGAIGSYNFADVNLTGDTSALETNAFSSMRPEPGRIRRSDPGSLANAMLSGADLSSCSTVRRVPAASTRSRARSRSPTTRRCSASATSIPSM